ncbi:hypothetical protein Acr_07g0005440 [Actinidia rufa]|uniref:Uncharacterized protein n=1 Tax=Actinidia rufa TaxID=165716 RepID=A0A7J0EXM6_9ERIC|nr:hypothetical protein Acr_07g0005440 [Actinidia rufa]
MVRIDVKVVVAAVGRRPKRRRSNELREARLSMAADSGEGKEEEDVGGGGLTAMRDAMYAAECVFF